VVAPDREPLILLVRETVTDTVGERVKGKVVGIPVRDTVLVTERVIETDRVLVTETVPENVARLEAPTVLAPERVTEILLVRETVTEPVGERVKGNVVGIPVRDTVLVGERVRETEVVLVTDTVTERVPTWVVGIPVLVTDLVGESVRETDLVLVKETVTDCVALCVVGSADGEPLTLRVRETVTEVVTDRVKGKLVAATVRVSVTVTDFEYVGLAE
jgi:hypothetical protein